MNFIFLPETRVSVNLTYRWYSKNRHIDRNRYLNRQSKKSAFSNRQSKKSAFSMLRQRFGIAQSPFGPFGIERGSLQTNQPIQLLQIIHIINTMNIVSYRIMRVFCAIYASPNHHPAPRGITKKNKICTRFEKNYFKFSVCFGPRGSMRFDSSGRGGRSRDIGNEQKFRMIR